IVVTAEVHVPTNPPTNTIRKFTVVADYVIGGENETARTALSQLNHGEVAADLAALFNNVGTTTLDTVATGDYDGDGNSFSRELLAEEGVTPGATVEAAGASFTWPDTEPGEADNVTAEGQSFRLEGTGTQLAFLGSGLGSGGVSGDVVVHYSDG